MILSPKQDAALLKVRRWINDPSAPQIFYFAGVAGSGKSTILSQALGDLDVSKICYMAPTGKAALVMRSKGCAGATTVHSAIYRVAGDSAPSPELIAMYKADLERLRAIDDPGARATAAKLADQITRAEEGKSGGPRFSLKLDSDLRRARVGVIDECSMIDKFVGRDLESFGVKLLVVGDPAQLPPVYGAGYFTSRDPDVFLDEIHRQALGSPILMLADLARHGQRLPYGQHGDGVEVVRSRQRGGPEQVERARTAEMILVGRNKTRHACNAKIRHLLGRNGVPVVGDRVLCRRNDHELGLLNGSSWTISRCIPNLDAMTAKIEVVAAEDRTSVECTTWLHHFMAREDELKTEHDRRDHQEFSYGWAQTVHTSQGSQYDDVLLFDESQQFNEPAKHLYTGVTRAARTLTVVV